MDEASHGRLTSKAQAPGGGAARSFAQGTGLTEPAGNAVPEGHST